MTFSTWDPLDKDYTISLSGGNLTAAASTSSYVGVRAIDGKTSGTFYFEVDATSWTGSQTCIGLCTQGDNWNHLAGANANGIYYYDVYGIYMSGSAVGGGVSSGSYTGKTLCIAVDLNHNTIWFRINNGNWNNSGTANPTTNTSGIDISSLLPGPWFPVLLSATATNICTTNFGSSTFAYTPPSGFGGWTSNGASAGTAFNPSDTTAGIILSNSNATVNPNSPNSALTRAVIGLSSGKTYFEWFCNKAYSEPNSAIGVALLAATGAGIESNATDAAALYGSGEIHINGTVETPLSIGTVSGSIIGVAVDLTNNEIWFRIGNGLWNGSGTANPATNTGGNAIGGLSGTLYAFWEAQNGETGWIYSLNTSSQMKMPVPSGFAIGIPSGTDSLLQTGNQSTTGFGSFNKSINPSRYSGDQSTTGFGSFNKSINSSGDQSTTGFGSFNKSINSSGDQSTTGFGSFNKSINSSGDQSTTGFGSFNKSINSLHNGVGVTTHYGILNSIDPSGIGVSSEIGTPSFSHIPGNHVTTNYGVMSNPFGLTGEHVITQFSPFTASVVNTNAVLFIIPGVVQSTISAGVSLFPTSEDISLTSNNYISGSSQYYSIGAVYWNGVLKVQGTDWQFVTPAAHPTYTHMIHILNPPSVGTVIRLVYNAWNIQINKNFIITSYPVPFSFYNTSIIADSLPNYGLYFTVQYLTSRPGTNPQSLLARYPVIYDEMLVSNTQYDSPNGFETYRPIGYQVYNTTNNHVYEWSGTSWSDSGLTANGTKFYIKRDRTIYELSGGVVSTLYVAGSGASAIPQVLTYPPSGEGVAFDLFIDAAKPGADINYPAAYQIYTNPGNYDPWIGT